MSPPGKSVVPSSNKPPGKSNTSMIPQLPIEVIGLIWQFLSLKERVKVQRVSKSWCDYSRRNASLWKNATYFSDHFTEPDICKDAGALSKVEQWANMKFSRFAISFQSTTKDQIMALKRILDWLPSMEVQDLVINLNPNLDVVEFDFRSWSDSDNYDNFPGIHFLPEERAQRLLDNLRANVTAEADEVTIMSTLGDARNGIEMAMIMAQNNAISNCQHLRSLLLDSPFDMPFGISQDDPITQCKLDILSLRNADYDYLSNLPDTKAVYSIVKEARVLDLIDWYDLGYHEMMNNVVAAASQSLEYLTFIIQSWAEDKEDERTILDLPRLKHLHFLTIPIHLLKINCPNLESLRLRCVDDIDYFPRFPSVKMLFIEEPKSFEYECDWHLLAEIGADRLETLIIYNESLTLRTFTRFFSNAKGLPHLRKLVVLTCGGWRVKRLSLEDICEYSLEKLRNIRKIDTLIWQYDGPKDPSLYTQGFIREHFATKLECIKAPSSSLEYSAEVMGNFVEHKSLVDRLLFFDKFLSQSSQD